MKELISEPITPLGDFDTSGMGRGEPGLPAGFTWRGRSVDIVAPVAVWKQSAREGGVGERYLRRHYFELQMSDDSVWTVYFVRQAARSNSAKCRWFLYTIDQPRH